MVHLALFNRMDFPFWRNMMPFWRVGRTIPLILDAYWQFCIRESHMHQGSTETKSMVMKYQNFLCLTDKL